MGNSAQLVHNFKSKKKQKASRGVLNKVLMEIMMNKIDAWQVTSSPGLDIDQKYFAWIIFYIIFYI